MKTTLKFILLILVGIVLIFGCMYFFITSQYFLQDYLLSELGSSINGSVKADKISFSPFMCELNINNIEIDSPDNFSLKADSVDLNFDIMQLLFKKVQLKFLIIDNANITITQHIYEKEKKVFGIDAYATDLVDSIVQNSSLIPANKHLADKYPLEGININLNNIKINNLNIEYIIKRKVKRDSTNVYLKNFYLDIPNIKTNFSSTGRFKGELLFCSTNEKNKCKGKFDGDIKLNLSKFNFPTLLSVNTNLKFDKTPASKSVLKITSSYSQGLMKTNLLLTVKNMSLLPFFKTFLKGSYNESDGLMKELRLEIVNEDLTSANITKNIHGQLQMSLENISLPTELCKYDPFKIVFLPINVMANIDDYTKSKISIPPFLKKIFLYTDDVVDGVSTLKFKKGNIDLTLKDGIINFNEFMFKGKMLSPVNILQFSGTVDFDGKIDLKTKTTIAGIQIPLVIKGTIEKPKPIVTTFIPDLVSNNTMNIINTGKDSVYGIIDTGGDAVNILKEAGKNTAVQLNGSIKKIIQMGIISNDNSRNSKIELKSTTNDLVKIVNSIPEKKLPEKDKEKIKKSFMKNVDKASAQLDSVLDSGQ